MVATRLDPRWSGVDGIFGGHVFGRVADAAVAAVEHRLAALTVCFVASVKPGDAEIDLDVLHEGRRTATSRFALVQQDRVRAHGLAEHTQPGEPHLWADRHELPPRPAVGTLPADGQLELVFRDRLDLRIVENSQEGRPGGGWVRLNEAPAEVSLDSPEAVLATLLDVMPPALYTREVKPVFVPTLSFTAHFRTDAEVDPSAWMFVSHTTSWATGSTCIDDATVWDADGYLLAHGRQARAVRWAA
ncbi:acyl-CoA thioesterase II [Aeromicrobium sp. Leaf350]|uniref:acyl-CoA thioesterase n=1 Tax=Aeromicrobium sp. Leaf350 TaxID=2876565 RepID=UPI001E54E853|nr:thioesterase family protein [Aeromicrobium sp. Leaf350]